MNRRTAIRRATLAAAGLAGIAMPAFADPSGATPETGSPSIAECIAASNESLALKNQHRLHEARSRLLVCAADGCPADIRGECSLRVTDVNARIPTIVFEAHNASGSDQSAVRVTMDGHELTDRLDGRSLSIDPGEHSFTFEAAGLPVLSKVLVIHEGEKNRREPVILGIELPAAAGPTCVTAPAPLGVGRDPASARRTTGLVVGGVGLAAASVGVTLLVLGASLRQRGGQEGAAWPALGRNDDAAGSSDEAAGFVVGGAGVVGLAVATYLVLSRRLPSPGPSGGSPRLVPIVGPRRASIGVSWSF